MKKVIDFLTGLHANNDRGWFEEHKGEYKEALKEFEQFVEKLISGIAAFDPTVTSQKVKDCTFRIYRDVRFSHDKRPYKNYMGAYIAPYGKKSGWSGYYFHVEPVADEGSWSGGSLLSTGLYCPDPDVLYSVREEIVDNGVGLQATIDAAGGFTLDETAKLKRLPKDFADQAGSPHEELLKLKDIYVVKRLPLEFILADNLLERTLTEFRKTKPLNDLLNRAVEYAKTPR